MEGWKMTRAEYNKCEQLMLETIVKMKQVQEEYAESERHKKYGNMTEWETTQRKADQYYGEAVGINQVLAVIGFKHERMKELSELL